MEDKRRYRIILALVGVLALSGCAGSIERWIVSTRIHQGALALANGNPDDALHAYALALRVDPNDLEAQSGFVEAAGDEAQAEYSHGHFDDALATIAQGLRVDPLSVRLDALKTQIGDAKLKQEIVISNYPTYQRAGREIVQSYVRLTDADKLLVARLRRFEYTYDVSDVTAAIKQSYELELEVAHLTTRLVAYRQLVEAGGAPSETAPATGGSLLPLP
ncbi:MAG: tetratricopeptide repeat protein [Candidatus Tyrphobacter sp.]